MDIITLTYLVFMFIALYMFSFFIILTFRNRELLFSYPNSKEDLFISVLIPAHNEEDSIADTIKHVYDSDYPKDKFEVIVINNASNDGTGNVLKKLLPRYKNLKVINTGIPGKANALNMAIKQAKGELIAVVDSDSFPDKGSIKKLTGYFYNKNIGAVTSFVSVRNKEHNFFAKIQSIEYLILGWSRKLLDFVDSVYVTNGPLSMYRKEYVVKVGGFDTKTVTEDIDITWNMLNHGYSTAMCLDAHVSTIVPHKYKAWFRQRTRWGTGGLQAISKYRSMFFRKGMFGAFILPYVSFSIIVSIFAFLFSVYLLFRFIIARFLTLGYSISTESTVFTFQEINLYPSVIIFYFVVLFTLSISYSYYVLNAVSYERNLTTRKFFNIIFYSIVYLTLYPIVWFSSIYKYIKKDMRW